MNVPLLIIILTVFTFYPTVHPDPTVCMTLRMVPPLDTIVLPLKVIGNQSATIDSLINHAPYFGIFSTYAGSLKASDAQGSTCFTRKHTQPFVYIIVTERITPIIMFGNTVHHWELMPNANATMHKMTHVQDKESGTFFWDTQQLPLPSNHIIPLESITIFANPDTVIIKNRRVPTYNSPNFVLPPIYVTKEINSMKDALYMIHLRYLFSDTKKALLRHKLYYQSSWH